MMPHTKDTLVQQTTAEYLEQQLGTSGAQTLLRIILPGLPAHFRLHAHPLKREKGSSFHYGTI